MASPRGPNQEGSQMEEENRSQEKETETSAVKWGMVMGPNWRTWESSTRSPEAPAKISSQRRARKAVRVARTPEEWRCRRGNSRPSVLGVTHSGPTK